MFRPSTAIKYRMEFNQNISMWRTGNVVAMDRMFMRSDFNQDISSWRTASVTKMDRLFSGCVLLLLCVLFCCSSMCGRARGGARVCCVLVGLLLIGE